MPITHTSNSLLSQPLLTGIEVDRAYREYCRERDQENKPLLEIKNNFLQFLCQQSNIDNFPFEALYEAAQIYDQQDGFPKPDRFVQLLEISSQKPSPEAHGAYLSLSGFKAANILTNIYQQSVTLADKNNAAAQFNLGIMYAKGLVIEDKPQTVNDKIAIAWFLKAAKQGHASAQYCLGYMNKQGRGIPEEEMPQRDKIAVAWLLEAAKQGHAGAQYELGDMYLQGRGIPEEEIPQKDKIAIAWFLKAAKQGHRSAQSGLGNVYEKGRGIPEKEIPQKDKIAVAWWLKAAKQGHASAQYCLGSMYEQGRGIPEEEMPQKDKIAVAWWLKAAKQGNDSAQFGLGYMYEQGRGIPEKEMPQKDKIAVTWFIEAAQKGNASAQCSLGDMYLYGRGILEEEMTDKKVMAYFWTTKAATLLTDARLRLDGFKITPYQKKKAEMMLARNISYRQMKCWFEDQKHTLKGFFLLISSVSKKRVLNGYQKTIQDLPTDVLFKIAQFLTPLSDVELRDLYKKNIEPLPDEIAFKAKYKNTRSSISLFFRNNPVALKVKSGAPLLLTEVQQYAKNNEDSLEANVYADFESSRKLRY